MCDINIKFALIYYSLTLRGLADFKILLISKRAFWIVEIQSKLGWSDEKFILELAILRTLEALWPLSVFLVSI